MEYLDEELDITSQKILRLEVAVEHGRFERVQVVHAARHVHTHGEGGRRRGE